ncbi:MAG TPA: serine/threonine-protein kinase [Gaiellaceae bacterium]
MAEAATTAAPRELVLDRYRPLRPLGNGGSGSVWLARDETTGLDVALKIVAREGKAGPRAEREAAVAAELRHERCLRAYACRSDSTHVYIAYEYAPGRTLRETMRAGELDDRSAVEAAAQVLEGLAHAHANGVVHRDVKPANVLLVDGEGISVRLLDFGLARMEEADTLTAVGDVPGTLAYIPPERLAGRQAGPAGDVWAVGVLLWEALAGMHPFWASSLLDTARAIQAGAPPLASVRPDLPRRLTAAIDRALALDPGGRPPAGRLAQALRLGFEERERRSVAPRISLRRPPQALLPAAAAALATGWGAAALPFYPHGWPLGLAALAFLATLLRERAGLAIALAAPVFPLGNLSLGLSLLYSGVALAWLALSWREPRSGLAFALGPLIAPVLALGLVPLALGRLVRSPVRRFAQATAAVLVAAAVAGLRGVDLPFGAGASPHTLGLARERDPFAVAGVLWRFLEARPALPLAALALGLAAAALPYAAARGRWDVAAVGAWLIAAPLLLAPHAAAAPIVAAAWLTCGVLAIDRR